MNLIKLCAFLVLTGILLSTNTGCYVDSLESDGQTYQKKDSIQVRFSFRDFETKDTVHHIRVRIGSEGIGSGFSGVSTYSGIYKGEDSIIVTVQNPKDWLLNDRILEISDICDRYQDPEKIIIDFTQDLNIDLHLKKSMKQPIVFKNSTKDTIVFSGHSGTNPGRFEDWKFNYKLPSFSVTVFPDSTKTLNSSILPLDSLYLFSSVYRQSGTKIGKSYWIGSSPVDVIRFEHK